MEGVSLDEKFKRISALKSFWTKLSTTDPLIDIKKYQGIKIDIVNEDMIKGEYLEEIIPEMPSNLEDLEVRKKYVEILQYRWQKLIDLEIDKIRPDFIKKLKKIQSDIKKNNPSNEYTHGCQLITNVFGQLYNSDSYEQLIHKKNKEECEKRLSHELDILYKQMYGEPRQYTIELGMNRELKVQKKWKDITSAEYQVLIERLKDGYGFLVNNPSYFSFGALNDSKKNIKELLPRIKDALLRCQCEEAIEKVRKAVLKEDDSVNFFSYPTTNDQYFNNPTQKQMGNKIYPESQNIYHPSLESLNIPTVPNSNLKINLVLKNPKNQQRNEDNLTKTKKTKTKNTENEKVNKSVLKKTPQNQQRNEENFENEQRSKANLTKIENKINLVLNAENTNITIELNNKHLTVKGVFDFFTTWEKFFSYLEKSEKSENVFLPSGSILIIPDQFNVNSNKILLPTIIKTLLEMKLKDFSDFLNYVEYKATDSETLRQKLIGQKRIDDELEKQKQKEKENDQEQTQEQNDQNKYKPPQQEQTQEPKQRANDQEQEPKQDQEPKQRANDQEQEPKQDQTDQKQTDQKQQEPPKQEQDQDQEQKQEQDQKPKQEQKQEQEQEQKEQEQTKEKSNKILIKGGLVGIVVILGYSIVKSLQNNKNQVPASAA